MIGARQSIGHTTVGGHPTNLDVWSVTIHYVLLVLQPTYHNDGIRPCGWPGNNNSHMSLVKLSRVQREFCKHKNLQ